MTLNYCGRHTLVKGWSSINMDICLRLDKNSKFDNDKHRFGIRVLKDTEMNYFLMWNSVLKMLYSL